MNSLSFMENWRYCGEDGHEEIVAVMLVHEFPFQYDLRRGKPYKVVVDEGNGKHYFVDVRHAKVISRPDDSGLLFLPLRSPDGNTYILKWRIDGEFDTYVGSTPHIPLSRPPEPFHLKEVQPK